MSTSVLICDDSAMARRQMARALPAHWDVWVEFAADGNQAIGAVEAGNAEVFVERLRRRVAGERITHGDAEIRFSVSLGVAELSPEVRACRDWMERADTALYDSKRAGRNRVTVYGGTSSA